MLFLRFAPRNFGLDVLRALAIMMVFVGHGVTLHGLPILGELGTGVDLFFVLSGFLIGRIYFRSRREGNFTLGSFWQARWWRTLPPYFAALALYAVAMRRYPDEPIDGAYALFIQNYVGMVGFNATWSLCVEEHFYLLFPVLVCGVDRTLGVQALRVLLPIAFVSPLALRIAVLGLTGELPNGWFWMTHFHCEGLIGGVWLAYVKVEQPQVFARMLGPAKRLSALIPCLLFVLPLWQSRGEWVNVWVFSLLAIGYTAWVRVALDWQWEPVYAVGRWARTGIQWVAVTSYSIYLTHSLGFAIFRDLIESWPRGVAKTGFILSASLIFAWLFFILVERTTLLLRERYLRRELISSEDLVPVRRPSFSTSSQPA